MADHRSGSGLQTLFAVFLGLMVTAFVGVGVYTFHPGPFDDLQQQIEALEREEQAIRIAKPEVDLTAQDRARLQELTDEINALRDEYRLERTDWAGRTSIILVVFATLIMAVSLVRAGRLPVISNALLIGGVLSMVYGVGWIVFSDDTSPVRFLVMTAALAVTLTLGYARFVRGRSTAAETVVTGDFGELTERVRALEDRLDEAASALRPKG